jgi:V8-like Glu-specific endopeptidase
MLINPLEILKAAQRYQSSGSGETSRVPAGLEVAVLSAGSDDQAAERHRKKMARLSRTASQERARRCAAEAALSGRATRTQKEVIGSLGQERIIGARDLLDVAFVELAIALARGVGRIRLPNGFGTGFLVGPSLLMTNNHVIASSQVARGAVLQMDYQESSKGELLPVQPFRLDPDLFFLTSEELDFTITAVQPISSNGFPLARYPWVRLISEIGKAEVGDPLNIIQHPRGELKQIAIRNNNVLAMPAKAKNFLHYTTDTEPGSSGSPCFNDQWDLVALHHSGVPRTEGDSILKKDGTPWRQGVDDPALIDWIANEGVRVSVLVPALRAASLKPEARDLVDRMLEQEPPNPIELARVNGNGASAGAPGTGFSVGAATTNGNLQNGTVTWTIPLQVSVSIGGLAPAPVGTATTVDTHVTGGAGAATEEEAITIDQDFKARKRIRPRVPWREGGSPQAWRGHAERDAGGAGRIPA